jgi:hypothetical protein
MGGGPLDGKVTPTVSPGAAAPTPERPRRWSAGVAKIRVPPAVLTASEAHMLRDGRHGRRAGIYLARASVTNQPK